MDWEGVYSYETEGSYVLSYEFVEEEEKKILNFYLLLLNSHQGSFLLFSVNGLMFHPRFHCLVSFF